MIRLAIVGPGQWGRNLIQSVQGVSDRVRFTHAVANRIEPVREFCAKHGVAITRDYAGVLANPDIDGIVSSGPAQLHATHSRAALEAGKPVLAVKPMALTGADARDLQRAAQTSGKLLALGFNRCFFPNVVEMRRLLREGAIGRVLHAEGNFCVDRYGRYRPDQWKGRPENMPAGALADHMLYLAIETLGPMAEVHTIAQRDVSANELADVAAVALKTQGGRSALLTAIGVTPDYYRFALFGDKGWIELRDDTRLTFQPIKGETVVKTFAAIDNERAEVEAFADAIAGRAPFPVAVEQAVHGVEVIEAMGRSATQGRPVRLGA